MNNVISAVLSPIDATLDYGVECLVDNYLPKTTVGRATVISQEHVSKLLSKAETSSQTDESAFNRLKTVLAPNSFLQTTNIINTRKFYAYVRQSLNQQTVLNNTVGKICDFAKTSGLHTELTGQDAQHAPNLFKQQVTNLLPQTEEAVSELTQADLDNFQKASLWKTGGGILVRAAISGITAAFISPNNYVWAACTAATLYAWTVPLAANTQKELEEMLQTPLQPQHDYTLINDKQDAITTLAKRVFPKAPDENQSSFTTMIRQAVDPSYVPPAPPAPPENTNTSPEISKEQADTLPPASPSPEIVEVESDDPIILPLTLEKQIDLATPGTEEFHSLNIALYKEAREAAKTDADKLLPWQMEITHWVKLAHLENKTQIEIGEYLNNKAIIPNKENKALKPLRQLANKLFKDSSAGDHLLKKTSAIPTTPPRTPVPAPVPTPALDPKTVERKARAKAAIERAERAAAGTPDSEAGRGSAQSPERVGKKEG